MAGGYSNVVRATKFNPTGMVRKYPNLQKKRVFDPVTRTFKRIVVSTAYLRTLAKRMQSGASR